jgi:diapolycopene oxygenase
MTTSECARVIVVGGGLGGLSAACTLAARGYRVLLLERNPWLGGKATSLQEGGFRFDLGPTVLTLPSVLRRVFAEAGEILEDHLELKPLDPHWRCFFADGTVLDLWQDPEVMATALERLAPGKNLGAAYRRFLELAARCEQISQRWFFWKPVTSPWDVLRWQPGQPWPGLRTVWTLRPGRSLAHVVRAQIADPRVAQMLDHFTQYVGSDPRQAPAVLCGIAHMQVREGVWYPQGGMARIAQALQGLIERLGVEYRLGVGVRRILLDSQGRACGVETDDGQRLSAAALLVNADSVRTYQDLLGGLPAQRFARRQRYEPACSGVVLYLGLERGYPHLAHHNFVFSRDADEEFTAIYERGELAPDPTCYLAAPARTDPQVAPPGGEALYVLVHTPYLRPQHDWSRLLPDYRRVILDKLARTAGLTDLNQRLRCARWLTPQEIHQQFQVFQGAIYGLASHGTWRGAFKPANRSPDVPGLYLAGGSAHPGPGVPLVIMSGWIAAHALDQDGLVPRSRRRISRPQDVKT